MTRRPRSPSRATLSPPAALRFLLTARCLRPIPKQEQSSSDLDSIAALEDLAAGERLAIDGHLAAACRADHEIAPLAPDQRMLRHHAAVAEQPNVALFGASDGGHRFDQRILAALARVAALAAHHHQPSAFEQLADQSDEEPDQEAEHDNRDGASELLRKDGGQNLVGEPAQRAADDPADRAVAPPCVRARRPAQSYGDHQAEQRPADDAAHEAANNIEHELADQQA